MSIDQLDLILYDMYRMDAWLSRAFGQRKSSSVCTMVI